MSFQIALTGLNAASTDLQVTSNNIANANTTGFKSARAEFADVYAGDAVGVGSGVRLTDVRQEFTQGNVEITQRQLDLAISGNGFFILSDSEGGGNVFSRVGAFGLDGDGYVQNSIGERLQVYPALPDGSFNTGALSDLQITADVNAPLATTSITMGVNLPADATPPPQAPFDATDSDTYNHSTSTVTYDSLGVAHTATFYYIRTAAGWDVASSIDGGAAGAPQQLTFGPDGRVATGGSITLPPVDPGNGAAPINIGIDLTSTTQFGSSFVVNELDPDGRAEGRLRSLEIDQTGIVLARYSNGQSDPLGKVAIASFSNPEGLQKVSDTAWGETFASGTPLRGEATEGNFGLIQSGALESSNVDLTAELVNMITAQRQFQANAQVISTMDSVTQTIINIR